MKQLTLFIRYGRTQPLFAGYILFCLCQIPCALANRVEIILAARFFAALFGASTLAITGGMYADFLNPVERGVSTGVFSIGVFSGPGLGPIFGTLIVESLGWRWIAWFVLMFSAVFGIICYICTPETYKPVLERRQARKMGLECDARTFQLRVFAEQYLTRPVLLIFFEPIVSISLYVRYCNSVNMIKLLIFTIYMSLVYGILYLTLTLYPYAFATRRDLTSTTATLPFLFILLGIVVACGIIVLHSVHIGKGQISGRPLRPEDRLPPVVLGSILLPAGIFWFAFTSTKDYHWLLQASSGVPIGCGIILVFMLSNLYLIEVYLANVNSALAINIFVRSTIAAAFPLLSKAMFRRLHVDGTGKMLGSMTLLLAAFPVLMIFHGPRIRCWSRYAQ